MNNNHDIVSIVRFAIQEKQQKINRCNEENPLNRGRVNNVIHANFGKQPDVMKEIQELCSKILAH